MSEDFPGGSEVKASTSNAGDPSSIPGLGWEDPLEEDMATHSNILAWRIPWMEKPSRLLSMGVTKSWTRLSDFTHSLTHNLLSIAILTIKVALNLSPRLMAVNDNNIITPKRQEENEYLQDLSSL